MYIPINVTDKHAVVSGAPVIVCNNTDYIINFTFDEEWDGQDYKTARFVYVQDGAVRYTDVVFTGTLANVPALSNVTEVWVGVFAGDLRTTTGARILCERSIRCGTSTPEDPTPSQYDQIIELLNGGSGGGEGTPFAVQYISQSLTEEQQAQARANIGAVAASDIPRGPVVFPTDNISSADIDPTTWGTPRVPREPMYGLYANTTASRYEIWRYDWTTGVWVFDKLPIAGDMFLAVRDIPSYQRTAKGNIWYYGALYTDGELAGHGPYRIAGERLLGYNVTINGAYDPDLGNIATAYSLDDGRTWADVTSDHLILEDVAQIMFKISGYDGSFTYWTASEPEEAAGVLEQNYTITENTTFGFSIMW